MRQGVCNAEWRTVLVDASHALSHLDADRLEEMAISCAALVRERGEMHGDLRGPSKVGVCGAESELAVFARVLEATKANLEVLRRLSDRRTMQLEYGQASGILAPVVESDDGDH